MAITATQLLADVVANQIRKRHGCGKLGYSNHTMTCDKCDERHDCHTLQVIMDEQHG